jgi:hypothetical protein
MLPRKKTALYGFVLLGLVLCSAWLMHKFYVSLTEIRYNDQTLRFEVSMRIFPDDLDRALLEMYGIQSQLATRLEHELADSLLMVYLLEDFSISADGKEIGLSYLGKEPESDAVWCYLESSPVPEPDSLTVRNVLLTEFFPDQVNIIQVYHGKWNKGLLLNRDQDRGALLMGE